MTETNPPWLCTNPPWLCSCGDAGKYPGPCPVHGYQPRPAPVASSALSVQVAGNHYKGKAIQPVEYIHANGLGFLEGCIVKRITRWREKDGITDLEKIKHEVDLLIELERRRGAGTATPAGV